MTEAHARIPGKLRLGFTLIELLIVVAVVAVLTAIALPMYRDYVVKSHRSDAIIALTELANLEEKYYSNQLAYTTAFDALSYTSSSPDDFYSLSIATGTTVAYTLTAQAKGQQKADDTTCRKMTLNSFGQRGAVNSQGADTSTECWKR